MERRTVSQQAEKLQLAYHPHRLRVTGESDFLEFDDSGNYQVEPASMGDVIEAGEISEVVPETTEG